MSKYAVTFTFEIEADSEQDAEEQCWHNLSVGLISAPVANTELVDTIERS